MLVEYVEVKKKTVSAIMRCRNVQVKIAVYIKYILFTALKLNKQFDKKIQEVEYGQIRFGTQNEVYFTRHRRLTVSNTMNTYN